MPKTGGRIGGYCHPAWIKAARDRDRMRPYAEAIARVASAGVTLDEAEWGLMLTKSSLYDTGYLKRTPPTDIELKTNQLGWNLLAKGLREPVGRKRGDR